jgi:hypothetical protein
MTQYYCAFFYFAPGLRRANTLSDIDAACVATALALCLKKKKKIHRWTKEWYKRKQQYTHTQILRQT